MRRAVKVSLSFTTARKISSIRNLLQAYRGAVNFYIRSLWKTPGKLDALTLSRLTNTRLSARYKSQALKQALDIVISTQKSAQALKVQATRPFFRGAAILDSKFVSVEEGRGSFDLVVRLSTLSKGQRISIPTRKTAVANKWLSKPLAKWVQGCALSEKSLILWVALPDLALKQTGTRIGIDLGVNKLVTISDGVSPTYLGTDFKQIRDKICRRKPGSKGRKRAYRERDNYIGQTLNQIPWADLQSITVEDLRGIKQGKKKGRGRSFRKAMAPWAASKVLMRIGHKAEENRVLRSAVPSAYTSQTCPPCSKVSRKNRVGEKFCCVACGYTADADFVGATNILARTPLFPTSLKSVGLKR